MIEQGSASDDDVVLAFLKAEIDSPKWGPCHQTAMQGLGLNRADLIDAPDLADANANRNRRAVLGRVRGFGCGDELFKGFPLDVQWRSVEVEPTDFPRLKYISNDADWSALSSGTRLVQHGARNLDAVPRIAEAVRGTIERGGNSPPLILVEADSDALVLVEGNARATACAVLSRPFAALIGTSPRINGWYFV
jgi:hypothetical protein